MASDDHPPPLRVRVTDERGRPLRRPGLSGWLTVVAPAHARGVIAIALVSDATMRRLNRQFAGASHATDVLSFPTSSPSDLRPSTGSERPERSRRADARTFALRQAQGALSEVEGRTSGRGVHLGDVVIAVGVAARQAKAMDHSLATELRVLALHGLLHLLGYDHSTDRGEMARVERRLRRKGGLRDGLIDRAGPPRRRRKRAGTGGAAAKAAETKA